jgi:hypothetical protein
MIRDIQKLEDDISMAKRVIEIALYSDPDIIEVIDNNTLDPTVPEDYSYVNIFPFIRIPDTQDATKNFITYSVDDMSTHGRNDIMKTQYVQFVIFVHKDLIQTKYGVPRHDLLGMCIRDIFNRSHLLGHEMKLTSSREGVTDTDFITRTLIFELTTPEVAQDGLFDNRYERFSLNAHDRSIIRENVGNR